jgi:hypothetical protein
MFTCRKCGEEKPEDQMIFQTVNGKRYDYCRDCKKKQQKRWKKFNPKKRAIQQRIDTNKKFYGLSQQQYENMIIEQDNRCAICEQKFTHDNIPYVDHDHITGEVRGLLHNKCNSMLGMANDDPKILRNAADYLENGPKIYDYLK